MPPKKKKDKTKEKEEAERKAKEEEDARRVKEELERKERKKMERLLMKDRKKQDNLERKIRVDELTEIASIIEEQEKRFRRVAMENRKDAKWERYMRCDGTPDPTIQGDINTYINLQSTYNEHDDIHTVLTDTNLDLSLINELKEQINIGVEQDEELTEKDIARFQETVVNLDNLLQYKLDSCTHLELCNASKNSDPETSNLHLCGKNNQITLCIWGNLGKNLRIKNFEFKEMTFTFEIPKILALTHCAIRLMYTNYDHYSPRSRSCKLRKKVQEKKKEIVVEELKKEEEEEEKEVQEETVEEIPEEKETTQDLMASLRGDLGFGEEPDAGDESNKNEEKEEEEEEEVAEFPFPPTPEPVEYEDFDEPDETIDLRANSVVGGIYHFNLLHLPPQPNLCKNWIITQVTYPPELKFMDYVADVVEAPHDTKAVKKEESKEETKEESENHEEKPEKEEKGEEEVKKEEEEKKEKEMKKEKEAKKEKDAHVDSKRDEKPPIGIILKIPTNTLFSENPLPALWNETQNAWVMKGFSDIRFFEDTRILQFKMHSFGTFALIQDLYINMPFQSWEFRPRDANWAHITITAAVLELEFEIKHGLCCITLPANTGISHIRDIWMKPEELIKELQWSGVNVFPSVDASKYVSIQNKSPVLEDHVYQQIALTASAMGFSWSRWNGDADSDEIILQATECLVDEPLQEDLQTFRVSKTHVIRLKLSEFDEEFSLEAADSNYFSNFYHLIMKTGSDEARRRIDSSNAEFRDCIKKILTATKVLTYS